MFVFVFVEVDCSVVFVVMVALVSPSRNCRGCCVLLLLFVEKLCVWVGLLFWLVLTKPPR